MTKRWMYFIAGLVVATAVGCHRGPPAGPNYAQDYPVHGNVVFPGGTPLRGGAIFFNPVEVKAGFGKVRWQGSGLVNGNGEYKIDYGGDPGKGLPAGEYKVTIAPRELNEMPNSNSNRIPTQYQEEGSTPLTVTVVEGDNTFDFELR
jgi:hypothetical protein